MRKLIYSCKADDLYTIGHFAKFTKELRDFEIEHGELEIDFDYTDSQYNIYRRYTTAEKAEEERLQAERDKQWKFDAAKQLLESSGYKLVTKEDYNTLVGKGAGI